MSPPWRVNGEDVPANILAAINHPRWWGRWFARGDWTAWKVFLSALFGLPLEGDALATFAECSGRVRASTTQAAEAWAICGRRAGKTRVMSTVAAWLATFVDWRPYLAPGEKASVMLIAQDRKAARVALRYLRSLIVQHPALKQLVIRETGEEIELSCGTVIEVVTASFRSTRGYSVAAILADEVSFWRDEEGGANPAGEIFTALRPSMATLPNSLLLVATTPYSRRGIVYETWRRHWAQDGDPILIWRAPTRRMNASVPQATVDAALELDPSAASAEYLAEFRSDIENFIVREVIDSAVIPDRHELPPTSGVVYTGFCDPSGGSSDSMTLAIAHRDKEGRAILDALRERRPPFSPQAVVAEFSALCKTYRLHTLTGDHWGGEFVREPFALRGIKYEVADRPKSDLYRDLLPLLNSSKVELLDHARLAGQLCGLERRTARSGKDSIDHAPGAHDDIANAVAGALTMAAGGRPPMKISAGAMARARERPTGGSRWPSRLHTPRCFFGSSDQR
jgi:hypothetical protein